MKGKYNELCYRKVCNNTEAVFYNHSTREHYCIQCARLINQANHKDAMEMFGHELCTLVEENK